MLRDQIKHTHAGGSVAAFNCDRVEDNVATPALYRAAEQHFSELVGVLFDRL